jgi:predicted nucleic acid-binding protein
VQTAQEVMMYTIDTSVHVNALHPAEPGSTDSQAFLEYVFTHGLPVASPTLLLVEVAAAIARAFDDRGYGIALSQALRSLPSQTFISLDESLAEEASQLAAEYRLRGADAVFAAVARREKATLVTLDRQQLERLSAPIAVLRPVEALGRLRVPKPRAARKRSSSS